MLKHLQIIEHVPLVHGPLWVGYVIEALAPIAERVTVTCPDLPLYRELESRPESSGSRVAFQFVPWHEGKDWKKLLKEARKIPAEIAVLTYVDPLFRGRRGGRVRQLGRPVYGIWFGPASSSAADSQWTFRWLISSKFRWRYRQQKLLQKLPDWLHGVWVLDPSHRIRVLMGATGRPVWILPDPWPTRSSQSREDARAELGLPVSTRLFLHAGDSHIRKGLEDCIQAWAQLDAYPDAMLLRVGKTTEAQQELMKPLIAAGRAKLVPERVDDATLDKYLCASDWILLPYRDHEASSGLLAGASEFNCPVIAPNYGLLGQRVAQYQMGVLFEHLSVPALVQALQTSLQCTPSAFQAGLARYREQNSRDRLIQVMRESLTIVSANAVRVEPTKASG